MDRATNAAKSQYANTEGGTVIPATRRADGTWRKERRVREGYVPPEERETYMSKGKQWRQEADKMRCPGFDEEDGGAGAAPLSKSAKKNAARKAKAAQNSQTNAPRPTAAPEATAAQAMQNLSVNEGAVQQSPQQTASSSKQPASAAEPINTAAASGQEAATTATMPPELKQIRALQKKVRQGQALMERHANGETLTAEEQAKMGKVGAWLEEIDDLQARLGSA